MSITEIESAIKQLQPSDLSKLAEWFEEFHACVWDSKIESDIEDGKLDRLADEAKAEYDAGEFREL